MHRTQYRFGLILACYFLPIVFLAMFKNAMLPPGISWMIFSAGCLLAFAGSLILFFGLDSFLQTNEKKEVDRTVSNESNHLSQTTTDQNPHVINEWQQKHEALSHELRILEEKLQIQTAENLFQKQQHQQFLQEYDLYKITTEEQLQRKTMLLQDSQQALSEQKALIAKHQQHITILESKERDLHYEIKTLLHLTSVVEEPPQSSNEGIISKPEINSNPDEEIEIHPKVLEDSIVKTDATASTQLKRCLDIATKMNGTHYFGATSMRFKDIPSDNNTLDFRRLFDSFRSENSSIVIVYSQKENKILFANQRVKDVLGWGPEKFVQNFSDIIQNSLEDWKKGTSLLPTTAEVKTELKAKNKSGREISLKCHLGAIQVGIFRQYAVGVLYEA